MEAGGNSSAQAMKITRVLSTAKAALKLAFPFCVAQTSSPGAVCRRGLVVSARTAGLLSFSKQYKERIVTWLPFVLTNDTLLAWSTDSCRLDPKCRFATGFS